MDEKKGKAWGGGMGDLKKKNGVFLNKCQVFCSGCECRVAIDEKRQKAWGDG